MPAKSPAAQSSFGSPHSQHIVTGFATRQNLTALSPISGTLLTAAHHPSSLWLAAHRLPSPLAHPGALGKGYTAQAPSSRPRGGSLERLVTKSWKVGGAPNGKLVLHDLTWPWRVIGASSRESSRSRSESHAGAQGGPKARCSTITILDPPIHGRQLFWALRKFQRGPSRVSPDPRQAPPACPRTVRRADWPAAARLHCQASRSIAVRGGFLQ